MFTTSPNGFIYANNAIIFYVLRYVLKFQCFVNIILFSGYCTIIPIQICTNEYSPVVIVGFTMCPATSGIILVTAA